MEIILKFRCWRKLIKIYFKFKIFNQSEKKNREKSIDESIFQNQFIGWFISIWHPKILHFNEYKSSNFEVNVVTEITFQNSAVLGKVFITYLKIFGCDSLLRSCTSRNIFGRFDRSWFILRTMTWPVVRCVTWKTERMNSLF